MIYWCFSVGNFIEHEFLIYIYWIRSGESGCIFHLLSSAPGTNNAIHFSQRNIHVYIVPDVVVFTFENQLGFLSYPSHRIISINRTERETSEAEVNLISR